MALLLGAAALQRPTAALVGSFGVVVGLFFASGLVSGVAMMRLRAIRRVPDRCRVGEVVPIEYRVANRSWLLPVCDLTIGELHPPPGEWSGGWVDAISGRTHRRVVAWYKPARRGRISFQVVQATSGSPLGLARKSLRWTQERTVVVTPQVVPLRRGVIGSLTSASNTGTSIGRGIGPGEDPAGLRPWRHGDRVRHVAWHRSTMPGELVVVERTEPERPRVRLVLNLSTPTAALRSADGDPRLLEERAIVLAASLASAANDEGLEYGLEVLGFPEAVSPCRRGGRQCTRIHRLLGELDLDAPRRSEPRSVRATPARVIVIHPERVDLGIGTKEAVHLTAAHLSSLEVAP